MKTFARLGLLFTLSVACAPDSNAEVPTPHSPPVIVSPAAPSAFEEALSDVPVSEQREVTKLIDEMLEEALGSESNLADPARVTRLVGWYTHSHIKNEDPKPFSILAMLRKRSAICGGTAMAFQLMMRRMGFSTRTVYLYGVPIQGGHVASEVWWDGNWHFFDPTFGAYITADGLVEGEMVDFNTLLEFRENIASNTFYAASEGRLGFEYSPAWPEFEAKFSKEQLSMPGAGDYRLFLKHMKAGATYDSGSFVTPYALPLTESVAIGAVDNSTSDITYHRDGQGYFDATSLVFIGTVSRFEGTLTNVHNYKLSALEPGQRFSMTIHFQGGSGSTLEFSPRKSELIGQATTPSSVTAEFIANQERVEIRVAADRYTPIDAIEFELR